MFQYTTPEIYGIISSNDKSKGVFLDFLAILKKPENLLKVQHLKLYIIKKIWDFEPKVHFLYFYINPRKNILDTKI